MSELTFGMRLTYDGKAAGAALDETKAKLDGVTNSSSKLASQYTGLNQGVKQHNTEVKDTEANVRKLLDRYDPLGAKLRQLQDDFNKLNAAAAGGKIAGGDDARTDLVYANLQKQITLASAATNVHAASTDRLALSSKQLAQANRQLPMQFTDIWVSLAAGQNPMMVMLQQGTQIKDSFGGIGNALSAVGGYMRGMINPVTLVTGALIAGGVAWYNWGESAQEAMDKASARLKEAEKDAQAAAAGIQRTTAEQIKAKEGQRDGVTGQLEAARRRLAGVNRETDPKLALAIGQEVMARKQELWDYERQIADLKKRQDEEERKSKSKPKGSGTKDDRTESEKAFADAWIETQRIISNVDPQAKANASWEHLLYLQAALGEQFPLTAEQMGAEYAKSMASIVKETDKAAADMSDTWKNFRDNTQRVFGDQLYDAMTGKFGGIEDAFKQMMFRMAANAAAQGVTDAMFGTNGKGGGASNGVIGGIMKFFGFGGGRAVGGSVASNTMYEVNEKGPELLNQGGKDYLMMGGKGGFVKPLGEGGTQISGGSQIVIQDNTQIHIDARSDRAQALSEVSQLIDNKQAQLVDTLRRQKVIA